VSWFKVDDTLSAHPKARAAGLPAMGLWVVAGSWSSQQLTQGFVPTWFVETWPRGRKLAAGLVAAGLWTECSGGWEFHDWTDCNPTAEKERSRRKAAADRQRRARERTATAREAKLDEAVENAHMEPDPSRVTSRVSHGSSHAPPVPTRPVPSRPGRSYGATKNPPNQLGGNVQSLDARDPDEPPRCDRHVGMARADAPPCLPCQLKRERWEASRSADAVFHRDPWCGDDECDPHTRLRESPVGVMRCPECHPLAAEPDDAEREPMP
jgi:hypothetical protein